MSQIQPVVNKLVEWGKSCNLSFNEKKTVSVVFHRSRKSFDKYQIRVNNKLISHSQEVTYLGLLLDRKLTWQLHIKNKIAKAKRLLMAIAQATRSVWGPVPAILRWAFIAIVRPVLLYAAFLWGHEISGIGVQTALRKLNRLAISTMANMSRSMPTRALELATNIQPLAQSCLNSRTGNNSLRSR